MCIHPVDTINDFTGRLASHFCSFLVHNLPHMYTWTLSEYRNCFSSYNFDRSFAVWSKHGICRVTGSPLVRAKDFKTRGHSWKLEKKKKNRTRQFATIFKFLNFMVRVVNLWNMLPKAAVAAPELKSFKIKVPQHQHGLRVVSRPKLCQRKSYPCVV